MPVPDCAEKMETITPAGGGKKKNTTQQGDGEAYRPYLSRLEREKNRTAGRKETCENTKNSTSLPTMASGFAIRPNKLKKRKQ
jgi:hypothetical protein